MDEIHKRARPAAIAAQCAHAQGQFWKYHDLLFSRQAELVTLDFTALAREIGLNDAQFTRCLGDKAIADSVENDYQEGIRLGVRGTPASYVNKTEISGAQPFSVFQQAIDAALK